MREFILYNEDESESMAFNASGRLATDVSGLGQRFKHLSTADQIYGSEEGFETIELTVFFGLDTNPYTVYNDFAEFISANAGNKMILSYESHSTKRCEVWIERLTKSQIKTHGTLEEKLIMKRVTPWFDDVTIEELWVEITNINPMPIPLKWECEGDSGTFKITIDGVGESVLTLNSGGHVVVDTKNKKATIDDVNAYEDFNFTKDTFLSIPTGVFIVVATLPVSGSDYYLSFQAWSGVTWRIAGIVQTNGTLIINRVDVGTVTQTNGTLKIE